MVFEARGTKQRKPPSWRGCALYALFLLLATYPLAELGYSYLYRQGYINPPSFWFIEDNGEGSMRFDAHTGFRISQKPARQARVTGDYVEFVGVWRGNNYGFPDKDDFSPRRSSEECVRLAVLGDSFTAAQFLDTNWPDRIEEWASEQNHAIELLNFSLEGIGLANWWGITKHLLEAEHWEIDGIVFAIYPGDLYRTFLVRDERNRKGNLYHYTDSWKPEDWPATFEQAEALMNSQAEVLSSQDFDAIIEEARCPTLPRPWHPYLSQRLPGIAKALYANWPKPAGELGGPDDPIYVLTDPEQRALGQDIIDFVQARQLPVLTVRVPDRGVCVKRVRAMKRGRMPKPLPVGTFYIAGMEMNKRDGSPSVGFGAALGGDYAEGMDAFFDVSEKGSRTYLSPRRIREHYFAVDAHWNQKGSDRFARYMKDVLDVWIAERVMPRIPGIRAEERKQRQP